jgi:hypothetical protein
MLTIYRRHKKGCIRQNVREKREEVGPDLFLRLPEDRRKCSCAFWTDGHLGSKEIRHSLKTRNQAVAIEAARSLARSKDDSDTSVFESKKTEEPISIQQARVNFLDYAKSIQLAECTIYKCGLLLKRLEEFGEREGLRFLRELNLAALDKFRSGWKHSPNSSLKQLENLRSFFNFCVDREWIEKNPGPK